VSSTVSGRVPLWRDVRVLRVVGQAVFAVLAVAAGWYLLSNLTGNMERTGIRTDFDYLRQPLGINVSGADVTSSTTVRGVMIVGIKNTALVAFLGIVLATVWGVILGVARLSQNWMIRKLAAVYVEVVRNIPVLILIFFFFFAAFAQLPVINDPFESRWLLASNRGIWIPWVIGTDGYMPMALAWLAGLVVALLVARWRTRVNERTGQPHHRVLWALGTFLVIAVVAIFATSVPLQGSLPTRDGRAVVGGFRVLISYAALLVALVVYTASHIAEIVRGSILAVHKGQSEAAQALALTNFQRMRFVILPQALRIMVPPTANQYLNLTKNSSLGFAIAYPEITAITGQIISNGRPAPQAIALLMLIYLVFSLFISALTNLYNRSIQYVAR
jgi:general L-amino acid transport system permease protein